MIKIKHGKRGEQLEGLVELLNEIQWRDEIHISQAASGELRVTAIEASLPDNDTWTVHTDGSVG